MTNAIDSEDFKEDDFYGIMPPDGAFQGSGFYLQKRPTSAGWVEGDEGYVQQTFLGASVVNFNISAGFSDTSNTLNVSLVPDEYNTSDGLPLGSGDDLYHNGKFDCFSPPPIGAPVFFKFGKNFATVHQAYAKSYEMIYRFGLLPSGALPTESGVVVSASEESPTEEPPTEETPTEEPSGEEEEETKYRVDRKYMEQFYLENADEICESDSPPEGEEEPPTEEPSEEEESDSECSPDVIDEARVIVKHHYLASGQTPSLDYADTKPPTPNPNTTFINKTEIYDPASTGIDPETMDIFTHPVAASRGRDHIVFGGILQSYSESKTANGNPTYSVSISDPKEILSNCTLILNDYGETTYNNKNLFNVYGFLEHDPSKKLKDKILENTVKINYYTRRDVLNEEELKKQNDYVNLEDCYLMKDKVEDPNLRSDLKPQEDEDSETAASNEEDQEGQEGQEDQESWYPKVGIKINDVQESGILQNSKVNYWFPITGFGMSRRSNKGIPLYRIIQALPFMNYTMPQEYSDNGYGGPIDFRGYKFALNIDGLSDLFLDESLIESIDVDSFTNKECPAKTSADVLKDIYIDLDDVTVLELIQEIATLFNKDFVVELLPTLDEKILKPHEITEDDRVYELFQISSYNQGLLYNIENEILKTALDEDGKEVDIEGKKYTENDLISAIISVTFIDRNKQPTLDEISNFLKDNEYESAEVGYDLINNVTDKFLVGAQKVDLYFFSSDRDRDTRLQILKKVDPDTDDGSIALLERDQWTFRESLKQQVLPFYGELADGVASIPVGFGPFQQILLNAESLNAFGVGEYYLATEMELRAAMVSFEQWSNFLSKYNRRYVETFVTEDEELQKKFPSPKDLEIQKIKDQFSLDEDAIIEEGFEEELNNMRCGVSVPRCAIVSNQNWYSIAIKNSGEPTTNSEKEKENAAANQADEDETAETVEPISSGELLPASPCFPPYGYPLYYARAEAIGIQKASDISRLVNNARTVQRLYDDFPDEIKQQVKNGIQDGVYEKDFEARCEDILRGYYRVKRNAEYKDKPAQGKTREAINDRYRKFAKLARKICKDSEITGRIKFAFKENISANGNFLGFVNHIIKQNDENAKKVHAFLKNIADEHLGKSFLVKLPKKANINYASEIITNGKPADNGMAINSGMFGFKPIYQSGKYIPLTSGENKELLEQLSGIHNYNFLYREKDIEQEKNARQENSIIFNPSVIVTQLDSSGNYIQSKEMEGQSFVTLQYKEEKNEDEQQPAEGETATTQEQSPEATGDDEDGGSQGSTESSGTYQGLITTFDYDPTFPFDIQSSSTPPSDETSTDGAGTALDAGDGGAAEDGTTEEGAQSVDLPGVPIVDALTQLEKDIEYSEGAFRASYNPVIDDWDFNYLPQGRGGWFDFSIDTNGLRDQALYPIDPEKLKTEANRISPYVIYHNSQLLHFKGGSATSIIQELVADEKDGETDPKSRRKRMDACTVLDNVGTEQIQFDKPLSLFAKDNLDKFDANYTAMAKEHIAYLKCNVDEKLYFAPRFCTYENIPVAACSFKLVETPPQEINILTEDVIELLDKDQDPNPTGYELEQIKYLASAFSPDELEEPFKTSVNSIEFIDTKYYTSYTTSGNKQVDQKTGTPALNSDEPENNPDDQAEPSGELKKEKTKSLIAQSKSSMNSEHIYALIKLPARPIPVYEKRFVDGPQNSRNPVTVARIWNRDTIKGGGPNRDFADPPALDMGIEEERIKMISKVEKGQDNSYMNEVLPLANPELLIDFVHPSPVIPDIVAIPLLSKEHCYGPWRSNAALATNTARESGCNETYMDIGGKIEYSKDENLSPWQFDGYDNMNKAGEIQVAFANNLMLFSEKGSFTSPGIAKGVFIGRPLFQNSPIVDSISLDVSSDSIRTTVSMEIFSKKYGKTEKQRQEQLARLTREEKLRRQNRNRLIRADVNPFDASKEFKRLSQGLGNSDATQTMFSSLQNKQTVYDSVVASVVPESIESVLFQPSGDKQVQPDGSGLIMKEDTTHFSNTVSFQKKNYLQEAQSNYTDINDLNNALQRTGGALLNDIYFPFDESVYNPYMSNISYVDLSAITRRIS